MEEQILKQSQAGYFKSATQVLSGYLTLTNKRVTYSGTQERVKLNHGIVGNVIRDKMEEVMGYADLEEELIFDIPLDEVQHGMKRYGLSKRLVISDKSGNEYKLTIAKKEREDWPGAIESLKKGK